MLRTVHIQARPGYAVGGLTVRSGLNINGLCVTFMKIDGNALDPNQSYVSDWVGDRTGGGEASVDGNGAPVIGVVGSQDDEKATALGLIYATAPAAAFDPPAPARPAAPAPMPPPPRATERPPQRVADEPPQAAPPPPEVRPEPAATEPAVTTKKAVVPPASADWPLWAAVGIPVAVFAAVAAVIFLFVLVPFGRPARQNQGAPGRKSAARPATARAVSPSALCKAPADRRRPALAKEEIWELREEDFLTEAPPADEPLLDALPVEPRPKAGMVPAVASAPPASGDWPRLEL